MIYSDYQPIFDLKMKCWLYLLSRGKKTIFSTLTKVPVSLHKQHCSRLKLCFLVMHHWRLKINFIVQSSVEKLHKWHPIRQKLRDICIRYIVGEVGFKEPDGGQNHVTFAQLLHT
jgi:hypothetical protein